MKLQETKRIDRNDVLFCLARPGEGSELFVGSSDFSLYNVDLAAEKMAPEPVGSHESYVTGAAAAGSSIVTGGWDGQLIWWDAESHEKRRAVKAHSRWIRDVAAAPNGASIVSVADDMVCRVWDAKDGSLQRELRGHEEKTPHHFPSMLYACAVSHDSSLAATADRVGRVVVWELATGKRLATLEAPEMYTWDSKARIHSIGGVRSLAFSPDDNLLAIGGMGQVGNIDHLGGLARVEVFDWKKGERTHEFKGDTYKGLVERLIFHHDGDWLFAAGGDHNGFYKLLDLEASKIILQDKAPMHVHDAAINESSDRIFAAGHGKIVAWEVQA